jgi:hypothetical protein
MVNLEHTQRALGIGIPVSEGIESRAQNDVLTNAMLDCHGEFIFDISASRRIKGPKVKRLLRVIRLMLARLQRRYALLANDAKRKRVIEDLWFIQELVRGAPDRD